MSAAPPEPATVDRPEREGVARLLAVGSLGLALFVGGLAMRFGEISLVCMALGSATLAIGGISALLASIRTLRSRTTQRMVGLVSFVAASAVLASLPTLLLVRHSFSSSRWQRPSELFPRHAMVASLLRSVDLAGLSQAELERLLGQPDAVEPEPSGTQLLWDLNRNVEAFGVAYLVCVLGPDDAVQTYEVFVD